MIDELREARIDAVREVSDAVKKAVRETIKRHGADDPKACHIAMAGLCAAIIEIDHESKQGGRMIKATVDLLILNVLGVL